MAQIIDIQDYMPHVVSKVICLTCGRRWLAVRPEGTHLEQIECPGGCGAGCVIETGEVIDE